MFKPDIRKIEYRAIELVGNIAAFRIKYQFPGIVQSRLRQGDPVGT